MIYSTAGTRLYAPRDLIAYLEGDFAAWCERLFIERARPEGLITAGLDRMAPDEDEEMDLLARMGHEHESRYLTSLREREPGMVELDRESPASATLSAMRRGAPIIYQANLTMEGWHGYPDFLVRVEERSDLGEHKYNAWDTKLALSAKPTA